MCRRRWAELVVLAAVACVVSLHSSSVVAQETTGALRGVVRSRDGQPLPGATVTIRNPGTGYSAVTTSDARGEYRFPALAPAQYNLMAAMDGFREYRQTLTIVLGQMSRSDIELELGAFADTVEVTATRAPLVDTTSTVVGMTVDLPELSRRVPLEHDVTQVAMLAPGTIPGDTAFDEHTPGQRLASFFGASVAENLYVVNGLDVTNFRTMLGSSRVPFEFLKEVQVKTGGYEAEYGRSTGGVINMITRSGSNTLHGAATLYVEPEDLQSREPSTSVLPRQRERRRSLEGDLSVGGPLIKDRLFYFLFAEYDDTDRTRYYLGPAAVVFADRESLSQPYWGGKIDLNLAVGHRLEATYLSDRVDQNYTRWIYNWQTDSLGDPLGSGVHERGGDNAILRYSGMLSGRALLTLQAGRNEFDRTDRSDGDECPFAGDFRVNPPVNPGCWVNRERVRASDLRRAYRGDLDWLLGAHALRAGIDFERNESRDDSSISGGVRYLYYLNETTFPELAPDTNLVSIYYNNAGGSFDVLSDAAYVQDSWAVSPQLTLNLGLRWERYDNRNGLGQTFIETDDQFAPRLGVVWDPTGEGRAKLYASYGTYYLPVASKTNIYYGGAVFQSKGWYILEGGINPDGSPEGLGDELQYIVYSDGVTPDPREVISDNFKPMSQDELVVGYERTVGRSWAVGVRGVARRFNEIIEDYSIQQGLVAVYGVDPGQFVGRLGNPGSAFDGWYDLDGDGVLDRIHLPADALGYPKAKRNYYALELTFDRRFSDGWMLHGSYVWSHLYGNYEGYANSDVGQGDAGITQTFDTPGLLEHAYGDLPNDHRNTLKVYGAYRWPMGLSVGASMFFRTGRPINSFGMHPTDPYTRTYGPVAFYTGGEPRSRGCCGRTDDVWSLDMMVRYDFHLGDLDMNLRLDVFNVFDNSAVTGVYEIAELANGAPNPYYGQPTAHQPPRRVRLGLGARF